MFTPEYLDELVEITNVAAVEFNMYLTNKVIDSIINLFESNGEIKIIPANQHRINLLKQSGILIFDIEREIEKRLPGLDKKIREAFYQAGYDINDDINEAVSEMVNADKELKSFVGEAPRLQNLTEDEKRILDAAYKRTNGEIKNLTRTTASDINQQFIKSCDSAWWKAMHGVDPATAIREAIDNMSGYGACVVYRKNGKERHMTVESAVRMCVLTGINQANTEITLQTCADMGCKNVLVSSHLGARYTDKAEPANHESWQGKVYSLSDTLLKKYGYEDNGGREGRNIFSKIKEFFQKIKKAEKYEDFETVTGYGTIEGFAGINCRHTIMMFLKGMKNNQEQYDSEKNKKAYDLSQKKRSMERKIRNTKKQLFNARHAVKTADSEKLIAELKAMEEGIKRKFDNQNSDYSAFCRQNGLRRSEERLFVGNSRYTVPERNIFTDILYANRSRNFVNTAKQINVELDSICIRKSRWSGKIIVDRDLGAIGQKEWNCDISLSPNADYATELHELLHARSISYYDASIYQHYRDIEEGSVELLTEEICRKKKIKIIAAYEEQVKYLRRINRRGKLYTDDYDFAVNLLNVPVVDRIEWLIKEINKKYRLSSISKQNMEDAFEALAKIMEIMQ